MVSCPTLAMPTGFCDGAGNCVMGAVMCAGVDGGVTLDSGVTMDGGVVVSDGSDGLRDSSFGRDGTLSVDF